MEVLGDAMVDVGTAIGDAGESMTADAEATDGSSHDAPRTIDSGPRPPLAIVASCDRVYTTIATTPDYAITTTTWRSEIDASEITTDGAIHRFWTRICEADRETFGIPPSTCPAGATCIGTAPPRAACSVNGGGGIDGGRIVLTCGSRSEVNYVNPALADTDNGSRVTRIEVEIE